MSRTLPFALRKIRFTISVSAILSVAPFTALICQQIDALRSGDAIRVSFSPPNEQIEGKLVSISADTIVLRAPTTPIPVPFSTVRLLEVKRRSGGSFMRSVAFGFLGGVLGGAVIGHARGDINTGDGILTATDNAFIGGFLGGAAGLFGGAVFGACCSSNWKPVPLPRT